MGWTGSGFCGRRTHTGSGTPRTAITRRLGREQLSAAGPQRQRQRGAGPGLLAPPRAPPPRPPLSLYSQPSPVRVPAPPRPGQRAPFHWLRGEGAASQPTGGCRQRRRLRSAAGPAPPPRAPGWQSKPNKTRLARSADFSVRAAQPPPESSSQPHCPVLTWSGPASGNSTTLSLTTPSSQGAQYTPGARGCCS